MWSTDAINWTAASAPEVNAWSSVTYGDDKFVALTPSGTNRVMWSYTGTDREIVLTFEDPNPDLQYFQPGDEAKPGVSVVSTNIIANTMSLNGGNWLGADGSGELTGDTTVTAGPFTAEGTFLSAIGTEVDLTNLSGRWIADNAGGIDFSIAGPKGIPAPFPTADIELQQ